MRDVFSRLLPHAEVRVFGSRAMGRARPFSDLDLLVRTGKRLSWEQRIALQDAFEQSELPFRVDIVCLVFLSAALCSGIEAAAGRAAVWQPLFFRSVRVL